MAIEDSSSEESLSDKDQLSSAEVPSSEKDDTLGGVSGGGSTSAVEELRSNSELSPQQDKTENIAGEENSENKKTSLNPLNLVKGLFSKKKDQTGIDVGEKPQKTPASFSDLFQIQRLDLRVINIILSLILAALIIWVIYYAANKKYSMDAITKAVSKINLQSIKDKTIETFKPIDVYLDQIRNRDFFKKFGLPAEVKEVEVVEEEDPEAVLLEEAEDELTKIVEDLKVNGISFGTTPRVMIKSEEAGEMYFLKQGQAIGETGAKIKEIFKDKVIIIYNGVEMEIL